MLTERYTTPAPPYYLVYQESRDRKYRMWHKLKEFEIMYHIGRQFDKVLYSLKRATCHVSRYQGLRSSTSDKSRRSQQYTIYTYLFGKTKTLVLIPRAFKLTCARHQLQAHVISGT